MYEAASSFSVVEAEAEAGAEAAEASPTGETSLTSAATSFSKRSAFSEPLNHGGDSAMPPRIKHLRKLRQLA
jgi:hypothetical protein